MKSLKIVAASLLFLSTSTTFAACRYVWVDDDFNTSTPAVQKQICDSSIDVPAIRPPSIPPIQSPQIRPIESLTIPPIGTRSCSSQSVYEDGRWVTKQICS